MATVGHYCKRCGKEQKPGRKGKDFCAACEKAETRILKLKARLKRLAGINKVCENPDCGKTYNTKYPRSRFCSDACRNAYHYIKEPRLKTCKLAGCGVQFLASNKREYCTQEHYHEAKLARVRAAEKAKKEANAIIS